MGFNQMAPPTRTGMPLPYGRLLHPCPALTNCKWCRMQYWELSHDAHKPQRCNICMTKLSHFPYTSTYSSTLHNSNRKHNIHHTRYPNIQHTSTLHGKKKPSLTTAATQQTFTHTPTQWLQQTQKETCAIYINLLVLGIYPKQAIIKYCIHLHHTLDTSPPHSSHPCPTQNK